MDNLIKCPNCGHQFPVETALSSQIEEQIRREYDKKIAQQTAIFFKQRDALDKEKEEFEKRKANENALFKERLEKKLKDEMEVEREKLKKLEEEKYELQIKQLQEENEHRKAENKALREREIELLKKENELKEKEGQIKLEAEREMLKKHDEIAIEIRKQESEKYEIQVKQLVDENEARKVENKALREREIELLKKENELKEKEALMKLEAEREMLKKHDEIAAEIQKQEAERTELKFKEYEKKLDDQKKLIDEMNRKAEQGSMQMQGEVQELALSEMLKIEYPYDLIDDVPKGATGADVIQTVVNSHQQVCGKIIYESKRTKSFSEGWIEKLKNDQREQNAMIAVIVTETLPKDMDRFGRKDGIWICTYPDVKAMTYVLREMIVREHTVLSSQENKGDKMESLYNYLVSDNFRQRVEAIVEGFSLLQTEMDREKRAMQKIWKEREIQIEKVIRNTVDMYGSIRGIAGNAIAPVQELELIDRIDEIDV